MMRIEWIEETASTNTLIAEREGVENSAEYILATKSQTSGRGQRSNSWESAPGKNLTFSMLWHPIRLHPREQFAISEAVALAIVDFLNIDCRLGDIKHKGGEVAVKWPNDIYVGDCKICGVLIENALMSEKILRSIIGVGLNVNQREFFSDAPNPISLARLLEKDFDLELMLSLLAERLEQRLKNIESEESRRLAHEEFKRRLWRREGIYPYRRREDGLLFRGEIVDVEPEGFLLLRDATKRSVEKYAFKEVEFLLNE